MDYQKSEEAKCLERSVGEANSRVKNPITAIRAKCIDCTGGSLKTVKECEITDCHLYPYRFGKSPYRGKPKPDAYLPPLKAIRSECLSCNYTAKEVRLCPCMECSLYPLRMGMNPFATEKRRTVGRKLSLRLKNMPCTEDLKDNPPDEYHDKEST